MARRGFFQAGFQLRGPLEDTAEQVVRPDKHHDNSPYTFHTFGLLFYSVLLGPLCNSLFSPESRYETFPVARPCMRHARIVGTWNTRTTNANMRSKHLNYLRSQKLIS
jgi:hypothetical protein